MHNPLVKAKESLLNSLKKRGHSPASTGRIPPGQKVTPGFPILDLGIKPEIDLKNWKLHIYGLVKEQRLTLNQLKKLGTQHYTKDFHCVTSWTKLDVAWTGIPFKKILEHLKPYPSWTYLIQHSADGYSTNTPREDIEKDDVFLAFKLNDKPIPKEHGTIRLIIPHLYAWKSAKFLTALEFSATDKPGFWETRGYHNRGNAKLEERYS